MGAVLRVLGVLDLVGALLLLAHPIVPKAVLLYFAMYLMFKGGYFAFRYNIASIIDTAFGVYMIAVAYGFSVNILSLIGLIYLGQKGLVSLL